MTATLTIKAEAAGALSVLDRVNSLIDSSVKSSERLAAVTATIRGHWKAIGDDVAAVTRNILGARTETERMAGSAKVMHAGFLSTIGVAQRLASEMRSVRDEAVATARVVNSIRAPGRAASPVGGTTTTGTGGFSFTPSAVTRAPSASPVTTPAATSNSRVTYGSGVNLGQAAIGSAIGSSVTGAANLVTSSIGKALELAWGGFKTGATVTIATVAGLVGNSVRLALKAEPIAGGFGSLTESKGLGEQTEVLEKLRSAARGTVSDLQLMTNANVALQLGSASTTKELELLIEGGRRLGKAMGRDATEGFNDLALGIGRQSKLILDNLGIIVNADQVYEDYAKSVGSTTEKISDQEKKLAFVQAAYEAVRKKMSDLGDEQDTVGEKIDRIQASFSNLSVKLGSQLLPQIGEVADRWSAFLATLDDKKVANSVGETFDALKGKAKSILDFILPEQLVSDGARFGASLWKAFTDPSENAFKVVEIRFEQLVNTLKGEWEYFWELVLAGIKSLPAQFAYVIGQGAEAIGLESIGKKTQDKALRVTNEYYEGAQGPRNKAAETNRALERRIAELLNGSTTSPTPAATPAADGRLVSTRNPLSAAGAGPAFTEADRLGGSAVALATARAEREAAEAAATAKADADKAAERALRDEISIREKLIDSMRDEQKLIEEAIKDLSGSRDNASRALRGEGPAKSLSAELDEAAKSLRDFPAIFDKIAQDISETGKEINESIRSNQIELNSALNDISRGLRAQANQFLQSEPQDGETVAVRSAKRRAQRDLRRSNLDLINGAFRSGGPAGFEGELGGFGAQNVERSGSILNQSFPRLESALARLRGPDGTTQVSQIETQLTALVSQQASQLGQLYEAQAKNFAEQAKKEKEQIDVTASTVKLVEQATETISAQAKEFASMRSAIARQTAELKKLEQAVRKQ